MCLLTASLLVLAACGTDSAPVSAPSSVATETPTPEANLTAESNPTAESTPTAEAPAGSPESPGQAAGAVPTAEPKLATPTTAPPAKVASGPKAEELQGIAAWINSEPLMISELKGKVVLVDFWTYTCVNCIRTLPYLKIWHSKYADDGLVIIGVHAPEFVFEEKLENVQKAVADYGIGWAVAQDNDFKTWRAYENRYWPAKYLIDKDGIIRYTHFGEGAYAETEVKIQELLRETGVDPTTLETGLPSDQELDPTYKSDRSAAVTRELYAGYERGYNDAQRGFGGYVGSKEYYDGRDKDTSYVDKQEYEDHKIYLQGPWHNNHESLRHARETMNSEDYMFLRFSAKSVNAVIKPEGEGAQPFKVLVTLDGKPLTAENKGADVVIEADGRSFLHVDGPKMYAVVEAPRYGTYDLKLSSDSPHFALFAFTFGVYQSGV